MGVESGLDSETGRGLDSEVGGGLSGEVSVGYIMRVTPAQRSKR